MPLTWERFICHGRGRNSHNKCRTTSIYHRCSAMRGKSRKLRLQKKQKSSHVLAWRANSCSQYQVYHEKIHGTYVYTSLWCVCHTWDYKHHHRRRNHHHVRKQRAVFLHACMHIMAWAGPAQTGISDSARSFTQQIPYICMRSHRWLLTHVLFLEKMSSKLKSSLPCFSLRKKALACTSRAQAPRAHCGAVVGLAPSVARCQGIRTVCQESFIITCTLLVLLLSIRYSHENMNVMFFHEKSLKHHLGESCMLFCYATNIQDIHASVMLPLKTFFWWFFSVDSCSGMLLNMYPYCWSTSWARGCVPEQKTDPVPED